MPIAAVAAPSIARATSATRTDKTNKKNKTDKKSAAEDLFVNPSKETAASNLPGPKPEPAPEPFAPPIVGSVTATMTAALTATANNLDGKADPGDTINYTVQLGNTSGSDGTGISFSPGLDSHTTFVPGSIKSTPICFDQTGVSTNEDTAKSITLTGQDPDGDSITFSIVTPPTNGGFGATTAPNLTYTPNANFFGSDSFTFRVNDGTTSGAGNNGNSNETCTVSITVNAVNDAPTFTVPGNPTAVNEDAGAQSVSSFITGVRPAQVGNTTEDAQTVSFVITNNSNPGLFSSAPALNVVGASYPKTATLTYTSAANQNGTATITYHAHDDGGTANSGVDNSADQTFTITVNAVNDPPVVVAPAAFAVQANMKRTGLTGLLGNVNDNADNGVNGCVSTTFTVTNVSATTPAGGTISNLNASTGTFDFDPPPGVTGAVTFTYTVTDTGCPGPGVASSPATTVTVNVAGPVIWFVNLGAGVNGDGRLSSPFNSLASANTKLQNLGTNERIFLYSTTATVTAAVGDVVLLQSSQGLIGQGAINAGGFDAFFGISPPAGTITRPGINSATRPIVRGTVTMKDNTTVQGVNIDVSAGATKGLTGSGLGAGSVITIKDVNVTSAAGNAVDFNNARTMTYTSSSASSVNVLSSTTGIALNIIGGTTIGAGGLVFRSISANGAPNGIVLNNTGTSGGLTVTGNSSGFCGGQTSGTPPTVTQAPDATDCTGGTIQSTTGAGILLTSTSNVSLTRMRIMNGGDDGIGGTTVTGFTLSNSLIDNNGNAVGEEGLDFDNLLGTSSITNSTIRLSHENNVEVRNTTNDGSQATLTVTGCQISNASAKTQSDDGVLYQMTSTANGSVNVSNSVLTANRGDHLQGNSANSAILNVVFTNNNLIGGHSTALGQDIVVNSTVLTGSAAVTYDINGNKINGAILSAITVNLGVPSAATTTMSGKVRNNIIGTTGVIRSCSTQAHGIAVDSHGKGTHTVAVTGNTMRQCKDRGINVTANDSPSVSNGEGNPGGNLNLTVTGNTVLEGGPINPPGFPADGTGSREAFNLIAGSTATDTIAICAQIGGAGALANNFNRGTEAVVSGLSDIRIKKQTTAVITIRLPGYAGSATDASAFVAGQNTSSEDGTSTAAASATSSGSGGGGFVGGAACATVASLDRMMQQRKGGVLAQTGKNQQNSHVASLFASTGNDLASTLDSLDRATQSARSLPANDSAQSSLLFAGATTSGESNGPAGNAVSVSRWLAGATSLVAQFVNSVDSLIVPAAHAEKAEGTSQKTESASEIATTKVSSKDVHLNSASLRTATSDQRSDVRSNHANRPADRRQRAEVRNHRATATRSFAPMPVSGGTFPINGTGSGFSLPNGKTITIKFSVTLNNPPNLAGVVPPKVSAQGTLSGAFVGNPIVTDDPGTVAANDATVTLVDLFDTTVAVASSQNPSFVGQNVQFTATVSSPGGVPTGSVQFKDGASALGAPIALTTGGTCPAGSACATTPNISSLTAGSHVITADYTDSSGNFDPNTGTLAPNQQVNNKTATTTTVLSSLNPSNVGDAVTFTAQVNSASATGTVQFWDGPSGTGTPLGGAISLTTGGSCPGATACASTAAISNLTAGPHTITADYSGDVQFNSSTGKLLPDPPGQQVNKKATTTTVTSAPNPSNFGQSVTFTAHVSSAFSGTPTGTVQFWDGLSGTTALGGPQPVNGSGDATFITSSLSAGTHNPITADYSGDAQFAASSGTEGGGGHVVNTCAANVIVANNTDAAAGSLRDALSTVCDGGTITFDPSVTSITLTTVELAISKNVTVTGPGAATLTVSGNNASRVFNVAVGKTVIISGMTITAGKVLGANGAAGSAGIDAKGGAVINAGTLTLSNVILSGSHSTGGDGGSNTGAGAGGVGGNGLGGGIYNSGTLTLTNTTVNGSNSATGGKGGDTDAANTNGNGGAGFGGGVYSSGTLTLTDSTISGNSVVAGAPGTGGTGGVSGSASGGGVYNDATAGPAGATITGSTISGNTAGLNGGGIFNVGAGTNATLTITNSTISGNGANNDGGGVYNAGATGTTTLTGVTVTGNTTDKDDLGGGAGGGLNIASGTFTLKNTIVAGNLKGTTTPTAHDITGTINTAGSASSYNLIGDAASSGGLTDGTDHNIVGNAGVGTIDIATVLNTTLADNGGPTKTHALVNGSPALEKGNAFSLTTDQRGFPRPVDFDATPPVAPFDDTDIGAFESQIAPNAPGAPNLDAVSDSGANNADDKTNVTTNLSFTIPGVVSGATVQLFRDGAPVASGVASGITIQLTDPGPLTFTASGTTYSYTAKQSFGAATSVASTALPVLISIIPDAPVLDPASDSGTLGDGITNDTSPTFNITNVVNTATVKLFRDGVEVASGTAAGVTIQLTDPSAPNGTFTYTAKQIFNAVTSDPSAGTSITITIKPDAPDLIAASDSGSSSTDNYTNDTTPTFNITGVINGANVELLRDGTSVANATAVGTSIQLTDPGALAGPHTYKARQTVGITLSPDSDGLDVTIDTSTAQPSTPDLITADDSNINNDNVTSKTTPTFTGTAEANSSVQLFATGVLKGSGAADNAGAWSITSSALADGPYNITVVATDLAGNVSVASAALPIVIDTTKPTVAMSSAVGNPTATTPIPVTVTFSESVSGFTIGDIVPANGTVGNFAGGPAIYTFDLTPTSPGPVSADIAAGVANDLAGNTNTAATQFNRTFDPSALSVTITPVAPDPRNTSVSSIQIVFNKAVTGFDLPDLTLKLNGGANLLTGAQTLTSGDNITWTLGNLSGLTGAAGTYVLKLTAAGSNIKDAALNSLTSDATESWVTDTTPPDVTINQAAGQTDPVTGPSATTVVNFTAIFTEPVVAGSFTNADVTISGTAGATVVNISEIAPNDGTHFNVAIGGMTQSGTVIANIPAGAAQDAAGNGSTVATFTDNTVTFFKNDFTTFEVNTTADTDDGSCDPLGTGPGNQDCTLREAINAANADAGLETITFNSTVFAAPGPYTINLTGALPDLSSDMTINGPGANVLTVKRDTGGNYRIFTVFSLGNINLTINGLTVSNGNSPGGGILNNNTGTVTVSNSVITGNSAAGGDGGGILLIGSAGTLNLTNSTISDNSAGQGGGLSITNNATVNITNSTISGNLTPLGGGGLYNVSGALTITASTITNNRADNDNNGVGTGGGIFRSGGTVVLRNTIVGHDFKGGVLQVETATVAGTITSAGNAKVVVTAAGMPNNPKTVNVAVANADTASQVAGKMRTALAADADVSGFFNVSGTGANIVLTSQLPAANDAALNIATDNATSAGLTATPTSANTTAGVAGTADDISGAVNSEGFNLIQVTSGAVITETLNPGTNITGVDPHLFPLADNGGPTKTHALQCTSPAIDKGFNFTVTTDQRGGVRPFDLADAIYPNAASPGNGTDIGAVEVQTGGGCQPVAVPPNPQPSTNEDTQVTITLKGTYSQNFPLTFTITQSPAHGSLGPISAPVCNFNLSETCTATVNYTPSLNFNGLDSFKFKVSAGGLDSDEADVNVTVISVNDPPVANGDALTSIAEDSGVRTIPFADLLVNDSPGPPDEAGQTLTVISVSNPVGGTVGILGTNVQFTPTANYFGPASFQYKIRDNGTTNGAPDPKDSVLAATVTFTIDPVADTPSVTNATTNEDTQTTSGLVISRNAADGAEVTHFKITSIANGTLFQHDGTTPINNGDFITFAQGNAGLKFTPNANLFSPTTTFSFQVQASLNNTDAGLGGGLATATITVNAVADTPSVTNAATGVNIQTSSGLVITRNAVDSTEVSHFKITNITNGTLFKNDGTTPITNNQFITFAEGNAGLKFTPANNLSSPGSSFSFDVQGATSAVGDGLGPATTATITVSCGSNLVTNSNDNGAGSLRAMILSACPGSTITFDMTPGHVTSPINLTSGELMIDKSMTIQGPGANLLTISGNNSSRVFNVTASPGVVNFSGLTISNGQVPGGSSGGGILNNSTAAVNITNSTLSNNSAGFGGGILNFSTGVVNISNSTLNNNTASPSGGGIFNNGTGTVNVTNSTISGNTASAGGGIFNVQSGPINVTNSTITGNSATGPSGAGGGIHNNSASPVINLSNSIVALNTAGIGPDLVGPMTSQGNNLIGKNDGSTGFTNGSNGDIVGTTAAPINPLLGPLANNGGPTQTHALLAGSPALDAGNNAAVTNPPFSGVAPFTDQRGAGFARIVDGPDANTTETVDIGAFEAQVSLEDITDKAINEDTQLQFTFNVGGAASITGVTATSSNTALVPNNVANIALTGAGSTRTLTINPLADQFGTSTITITVNGANGQSMTDTFLLTVNSVNDAPVNHVPGPQNIPLNALFVFSVGTGNAIFISDVDAGSDPVQVTLKATDGTITLNGTSGLSFTVGDGTDDPLMTFTGSIANINAALEGMKNLAFGSGVITITTNDLGHNGIGGPLSDTDTIQVTVVDNLAPLLLTIPGTDRAIAFDSVTFVVDPFSLVGNNNFTADHRTHITLFALHAQLRPGETASAITAEADVSGTIVPLIVESVMTVPNFDWLTQIVVKFPDGFSTGGGGPHDAKIRIRLRGQDSNQAVIIVVPAPKP